MESRLAAEKDSVARMGSSFNLWDLSSRRLRPRHMRIVKLERREVNLPEKESEEKSGL